MASSSASYYSGTATSALHNLPVAISTSGMLNTMSAHSYDPDSDPAAVSAYDNTRFEPSPDFPSALGRRQSLSHDTYINPMPASTLEDVHSSILSPPVSPISASRPASESQSDYEDGSQHLLGSSSMVFGDDEIQMRASGSDLYRQRSRTRRFRLTHTQTRFLQSEFARQAHPDAAHRERLAREIPGLSARQVQVWFQNRRAKMKRLSIEDRESMLSSRALPEDFDMTPALRPAYEQESGSAQARVSSQSSAGPSNWEQRRASLKRSLIHREQTASPAPIALQGTPNYRPFTRTSSVGRNRYGSASSGASHDISLSKATERINSEINVSQSSLHAHNQYAMLQDGSVISGYGSGLVDSTGTSMYAGTGTPGMHEAAADLSKGKSYIITAPDDRIPIQARAYEYQDAIQRRQRNQRHSYDMSSEVNLHASLSSDIDTGYTFMGASNVAPLSEFGYNPGMGLYSAEKGNARMRRATAPSGITAGPGAMTTGWTGSASSQGLSGAFAQYTMTDASSSSMADVTARLGLPPSSSSPPSPLTTTTTTTTVVPGVGSGELLPQSESIAAEQASSLITTSLADDSAAAAAVVAANYFGGSWQV